MIDPTPSLREGVRYVGSLPQAAWRGRRPAICDASMRDFAGRRAVVTGAASGLGAAMARAFADAGMSVLVADVN